MRHQQAFVSETITMQLTLLRLLALFWLFSDVYGTIDLQNWMSNLPRRLQSRPLSEIAIPGSHNSGSYSFNRTESFKYGMENKYAKLLKFGKNDSDAAKFVTSLMYRWGKTQDLNLTGQLENGVRYLDMRLALASDNQIRVTHGLLGITLREALDQIQAFRSAHPMEVILIDYNHVHVPSDEVHRRILNESLTHLLPRVCPKSVATKASLRELWDEDCNTIFFYAPFPYKNDALFKRYVCDNKQIEAPFREREFEQRDTWLKFLDLHSQSHRTPGIFHVTQGIMVPHWLEILASGVSRAGSLQRWISDDATTSIVKWVREKHSGKYGINIVIADFVESNNFTSTVLALNGAFQPARPGLGILVASANMVALWTVAINLL